MQQELSLRRLALIQFRKPIGPKLRGAVSANWLITDSCVRLSSPCIDANVKAPSPLSIRWRVAELNERPGWAFTIGLHQEIFADFSVRLTYISKNKKDVYENVLYSPDLEKDWYSTEQETKEWWVPFRTIIPGNDDYDDKSVTVFFPSLDAPQ